MLFSLLISGVIFALFFYCQALQSGLGYKRWTLAGMLFGPLVWPMFCMQKRMKVTKRFGFSCLILKA